MRKTLVRGEEEFAAGMKLLAHDLSDVFRLSRNVPPEHRAWARDVLEQGARLALTGSGADRQALSRMLNSPPQGMSAQLLTSLTGAVNSAVSLPGTQEQRESVRRELENAASQLFSGHLPGQGPPAGMMDHYRRVMRSTPRRQ